MRLATLLLLTFTAPLAAQSTWFVDAQAIPPGTGTALAPYTSIDFALSQPSTQSGDLVLVRPGTYAESVRFVAKGISVVSTDGPAATVIDAGGATSAVSFIGTDGSPMVLDGFRLTGGGGTDVGGVFQGGGVYALDALVELRRCAIADNDATLGGGLYLENSVTQLHNTRVLHNLALPGNEFPDGGGLYARGGTLTALRVIFNGNHAGTPNNPGSGGGLFIESGADVTLQGCRFWNNTGERSGGAISGAALIDSSRFAGNLSQFGGAIDGDGAVSNSVFVNNRADSASGTSHFGGAVYRGTYSECTFRDNFAYGEGSAANSATLLVCEVLDNDSAAAGGFVTSGAVDSCMAIECNIAGNSADGTPFAPAQGGGAANSTLIDCELSGNRADSSNFPGAQAYGGGAYGGTLVGCRVFDNTSFDGGGVAFANVERTELFGNTALNFGSAAFDSHLDQVTVVSNLNSTTLFDGVYVESNGSVSNSILWGHLNNLFAGPGANLSVTYSDVGGGWPGVGNIDADPLFFDAANDDFHLTARSPCIDAGDPNSTPDPDGSPADMGAHPFDPTYTGS